MKLKNKNKWKIAFLILFSFNLLIVILFFSFLVIGSNKPSQVKNKEITASVAEFVIQTDKNDLNSLINHYIEDEGLNGPIDYHVLLDDEVELYGSIPVFSHELELKMTFEPEALENGDLILRQESISLGGISLPVNHVMKLIRDSYKLPEWVIIQPNEKTVYVNLQQMELNGGIQVRAKEFDLTNNRILFSMFVPAE